MNSRSIIVVVEPIAGLGSALAFHPKATILIALEPTKAVLRCLDLSQLTCSVSGVDSDDRSQETQSQLAHGLLAAVSGLSLSINQGAKFNLQHRGRDVAHDSGDLSIILASIYYVWSESSARLSCCSFFRAVTLHISNVGPVLSCKCIVHWHMFASLGKLDQAKLKAML